MSNQGQQNVQKGGDQTNVGSNANAVNVGQANNQVKAFTGFWRELEGDRWPSAFWWIHFTKNNIQGTSGTGPSYDAPRGGPFNAIANKVKQQNLGQVNTQAQGNVQQVCLMLLSLKADFHLKILNYYCWSFQVNLWLLNFATVVFDWDFSFYRFIIE